MSAYRTPDGDLIRIRERVKFAGRDLVIVEQIYESGSCITSYDAARVEAWEPIDPSEWSTALAREEIAEGKRQAEEQARVDGERWGIEAHTSTSWSGPDGRSTRIVRSTRTQLVDVNGGRWARRTGSKIGDWSGFRSITSSSLRRIEEFLAGRERVDIVAERRKAESQ